MSIEFSGTCSQCHYEGCSSGLCAKRKKNGCLGERWSQLHRACRELIICAWLLNLVNLKSYFRRARQLRARVRQKPRRPTRRARARTTRRRTRARRTGTRRRTRRRRTTRRRRARRAKRPRRSPVLLRKGTLMDAYLSEFISYTLYRSRRATFDDLD